MNIREYQTALNTLGHGPIAVDGIAGRGTQAAARAFQAAAGLVVDGIVGPKTQKALTAALKAAGEKAPKPSIVEAPWTGLLMAKMGLQEVRNNAELRKFLASDGKTLGDPAKQPWCGDLVETIIALTLPNEKLPVNPYLARNWQKFGQAVSPRKHAVGVFYRGAKSGISGHVGILLGATATHYVVGGGNQSNAITSNALLLKSRLLDARWPMTFPLLNVPLVPKAGVVSTNEA